MFQTITRFVSLLCTISVAGFANSATAQTRPISAQEYIQSTSPLADGGSVTSRTAPGQRVQTITTIAQLPAVGQSRGPVAGYQPRDSRFVETSSNGTSGSYGSASGTANNQTYLYPAQNPAYSATTSPLSTGAGVTAFRQSNTLGLSPAGNSTPRLAQNCPTCVGGQYYNTSYPPAANQAPSFQPPSFNGVPELNIQVPGQTAPSPVYPQQGYQPNYQYQPNVGTPQYGAQGASWWTPFVSGSGVYTPLIKFRNMPPGTYLGQGVVGQPTAYVDGQPVRNLFRYISP